MLPATARTLNSDVGCRTQTPKTRCCLQILTAQRRDGGIEEMPVAIPKPEKETVITEP